MKFVQAAIIVILGGASTIPGSAFQITAPTRTVVTGAPLLQQQHQLQFSQTRLFFDPRATVVSRSTQRGPAASRKGSTALAVSIAIPPVTSSVSDDDDDDENNNNNGNNNNGKGGMPIRGEDGIYHVENKEQHAAFLAANTDKLIVLKCFAPWCRACKALEPKFLQIVNDPKYKNLPLVFADLSIQHNKAFVQSLGVLALPTIQFYVAGELTDTFPCGPSKVPILKRKLASLVNDNVDAKTRQLKPRLGAAANGLLQSTISVTEDVMTNTTVDVGSVQTSQTVDTTTATATEPAITFTKEERQLFANLPYFKDMSLADQDEVLSKAKMLRFERGSIIMREGKPGRKFYVIQSGEVEICQRTGIDDPLVARPSNYLGTVINRFSAGNTFGERALITGEPRAASIRATEDTTCWVFDKDDFPASCVLSGRTRSITDLEIVNDKYGVSLPSLYDRGVSKLNDEVSAANQVRGSVNRPHVIRGVDTDEEEVLVSTDTQEEPDDMVSVAVGSPAGVNGLEVKNEATVFAVLSRFRMIQLVNRCFKYIEKTKARWGDAGIRNRRNMLVSRLSPARRAEFKDAFQMIDATGDGVIELNELKRVMSSIGESTSDEELEQIMSKGHDNLDGRAVITFQDFMGIMAEAEFYHLFRDIFASLDPEDTGYVKARELDRVLSGVRDLISDDRKSLIDVEDKDMLIDYEQFSRMLLGSTLM